LPELPEPGYSVNRTGLYDRLALGEDFRLPLLWG
jgi:hypothetical protein